MLNSQGLPSNPYSVQNQSNYFVLTLNISSKSTLILPSLLSPELSRFAFPVDLPVNSESAPTFFHSGYMPCTFYSSRFTMED